MDRRQFLAGGATVTGGLLGTRTLSAARRHLGLWSAPAPPRATPATRDPRLSARVEGASDDAVALRLRARDPRPPLSVLVVRREYPTGDALASAESETVRLDDADATATVSVDVPRRTRRSGPWFYEAYARPGANDGERAYLCESRPYRWTAGDRSRRGPRTTDPLESVERERFQRHRRGNDYALTYRWQDVRGDAWTLDYRLRRSTHEAAVAASRGYVETYEESLASPIARDLVDAIDADARRLDGGDDADPSARSLPPGERFDRLVTFVQALRYANDHRTSTAFDYHRTVEETLAAGVGDCKDRTYLLAGLLAAAFDVDTALLFQPAHVLLGVAPDDVPDLPYAYRALEIDGDRYVPIEPSLDVRVGRYVDTEFVAVYADGDWQHADADAMVEGAGRVLERFLDYAV